ARVPASLEIDVRDVGAPTANLALVETRITDGRVTATIHNASAAPRSGAVTIARDGRELARATFEVAPQASVDVPVEKAPGPGPLTVAIVDDEGYLADNVRHLLVGEASEAAVLVITSADAPG